MPTPLPNSRILRHSVLLLLFFCVLLQSCDKSEETLPDATLISLQLSGITDQKSTIIAVTKTVETTVPYGTSVKSLTPIIEISTGASIVPASKTPQDFSQPVYYVLTSSEGKKTVYKVSVITLKQPSPEIISIDKNTIEAGESLLVKGKYFGNFQGVIQSYLVDAKNEEILVTSKLLDSTQIQITVPKTVSPQPYTLKINVNSNTVLSSSKVTVQYPTPEITSLSKRNILQGDTLFMKGNFITEGYTYKLQLTEGKNQTTSPVQKTSAGSHFSIIPKSILAGSYTVQILNESTQKISKSQDFTIQLYDINKPFVQGIISPNPSYKPGDKLIFKAQNFESFPARFFQIQLSNGSVVLFQNGVYSKITNTLMLDLPTTLKVGSYNITITLINTSNQEYVLELDEILVVK